MPQVYIASTRSSTWRNAGLSLSMRAVVLISLCALLTALSGCAARRSGARATHMLSFGKGNVPAKGLDQSRKPADVDKVRGAPGSVPETLTPERPGPDETAQAIGTSGKGPGMGPVLIISSPANTGAQPTLTAVASGQPAASAPPAPSDDRRSLRWLIPALVVCCLAAIALMLFRRRSPRLQG
jgi:hypothetical protein